MSQSTLLLTPEQSALIPIYKEKWKKILVSSDIIDRSKAKTNVILLYRYIGLPKPNIIFVDTPYIAIELILKKCLELFFRKYAKEQLHWTIMWDVFCGTWGGSVWSKLSYSDNPDILQKLTEKFHIESNFQIKEHGIYTIKTPTSHLTLSEEVFLYFEQLWKEVEVKIIRDLISYTRRKLETLIEQYFPRNQRLSDYEIFDLVDRNLWRILENHYVRYDGMRLPKLSIAYGFYYDLCYSVLGVINLKKDFEILQDFFLNCYWIFPFKDVCLISGRPSKNKLMKLGISV